MLWRRIEVETCNLPEYRPDILFSLCTNNLPRIVDIPVCMRHNLGCFLFPRFFYYHYLLFLILWTFLVSFSCTLRVTRWTLIYGGAPIGPRFFRGGGFFLSFVGFALRGNVFLIMVLGGGFDT